MQRSGGAGCARRDQGAAENAAPAVKGGRRTGCDTAPASRCQGRAQKSEARELQLVNDAAVKTLREHLEREEFMVRRRAEARVKHLRDQLRHADEVLGWPAGNLLEQSMEERKHEYKSTATCSGLH